MGVKYKTGRLEAVQLDQIIALSDFVAKYLRHASEIFEGLSVALNELKSSRLAIRRGAAPLNHTDLERITAATDERLADIIKRCTIIKYELGRLTLQADSDMDRTQLGIFKQMLQRVLSEAHGVDFLIKLK